MKLKYWYTILLRTFSRKAYLKLLDKRLDSMPEKYKPDLDLQLDKP